MASIRAIERGDSVRDLGMRHSDKGHGSRDGVRGARPNVREAGRMALA